MKIISIIATLFMIVFLSVRTMSHVFAQESNVPVNASVQISVCGNGLVEGGEDCDGSNLNNKTCKSLGYGGGALSCDISCSFDTSGCITATPTPIQSVPTPTQTALPSTTSSQTPSHSTPTETPTNTPTPTPSISTGTMRRAPTSVQIPTPSPIQSTLPPAVRIFDVKGAGKIEKSELREALTLWVNDWKKFLNVGSHDTKTICDINQNGSCELHDFSILLYYVER